MVIILDYTKLYYPVIAPLNYILNLIAFYYLRLLIMYMYSTYFSIV